MKDNKKQQPELDELFTNPEPWESWESKLVWASIGVAIVGIIVLGILVNWLILK